MNFKKLVVVFFLALLPLASPAQAAWVGDSSHSEIFAPEMSPPVIRSTPPVRLAAGLGTLPFSGAIASQNVFNAGWNPLLIGAGGDIRGMDIQCDQGVGQCAGTGTTTKFIRTDSYGAYVWITSGSCFTSVPAPCWKQVVTTSTMPAGSWISTTSQGVFEVAIAPSSTSTLYMAVAGNVYKSTNTGGSWATTGFTTQNAMNDSGHGGSGTNGNNSGFGRFMVVSPASANVVYVSINTVGTFFTTNGGTSWTQISTGTIGAGTGGSGSANLLYFDPSDATGNTLYIAVYGTGVFKCTSATTTPSCTSTTATGMPTTNRHMVVGSNGVLWLVDDNGNLFKYASATWSEPISGGGGIWVVAIDPANNSHVIAVGSGGVNVSNNASTFLGFQFNTSSNRTATDIPWLANTNETFMTASDAQFDPAQSNQLIFCEGIGCWTTPGPTTAIVPQWTSMSKGIEQLVAIQVIVPPGTNTPVTGSWDRPVFYQPNPNAYPSAPRPSYNTASIMGGWALDYASSSPTTVVAQMDSNLTVLDLSGTSSDGGNTWTQWGTAPGTNSGGSIAASNTTDFIVCYSLNGNCSWTVNAGSTWTAITSTQIPNLPPDNGGSNTTGWGAQNFNNRQIVAADRVTNDIFYLYNYLTSPNIVGVYKCTLTHAPSISCSQQKAGTLGGGDSNNTKLVTMPGIAGELFFTADAASSSPLQISINSGVTWNPVQSGGVSFLHVSAIGFGKTSASPAWIVISGQLSGVQGIYISKDNASTWTLIDSTAPLGNPGNIGSIGCDNLTPMNCYFSLGGGDGWAYYGQINWLLKRDLDPASNDNDPMWIEKAA